MIVSYHNFKSTPYNLNGIYTEIMYKNPDIIKMAVCANRFEDVAKMLDVVFGSRKRIIGLSMDEKDDPKYVNKDDILYFQKMFMGKTKLPNEFWSNLETWVEG